MELPKKVWTRMLCLEELWIFDREGQEGRNDISRVNKLEESNLIFRTLESIHDGWSPVIQGDNDQNHQKGCNKES